MRRGVLLAVALAVLFAPTAADARLSKSTARSVTLHLLSEAYLIRDWADDWDFYGCRRKGENALVCYGGVSGERQGKYGETIYTFCSLKVLIRQRGELQAGIIKTRCVTF